MGYFLLSGGLLELRDSRAHAAPALKQRSWMRSVWHSGMGLETGLGVGLEGVGDSITLLTSGTTPLPERHNCVSPGLPFCLASRFSRVCKVVRVELRIV